MADARGHCTPLAICWVSPCLKHNHTCTKQKGSFYNIKTGNRAQKDAILVAPFAAVFLFGLYSLVVVLYRVAIFPTCPDAAVELRKQMVEAEADLKSKGFKFD